MTLREYFMFVYGVRLEDVEPTEVPGYWAMRQPCGGREGGCREPIHQILFCAEPVRHTLVYRDPRRGPDGRWRSPHRTWRQECERLARRRKAS